MKNVITMPDYERCLLDKSIKSGIKIYVAEYEGNLYTYYRPPYEKRIMFIIKPKPAPENRDK